MDEKTHRHRSQEFGDGRPDEEREVDDALAALTEKTCKLMLTHGSNCCSGLGIHGKKARIYRFDGSSAIVSRTFKYAENPEFLREFLRCSDYKPVASSGLDDCSRPARSDEIKRARKYHDEREPGCWCDDSLTNKCVVRLGSDGNKYLNPCQASDRPQLFSHLGIVREAVNIGDDMHGVRVIIKDNRNQCSHRSKIAFWTQTQKVLDTNSDVPSGLVRLVAGADLEIMSEHDRCSYDLVGVAITQFCSTRELVEAIRDATIEIFAGHLNAYLYMKSKGCIIDFDNSSFINSSETESINSFGDELLISSDLDAELKERTSTRKFIAVEQLYNKSGTPITHEVRHDLESFYWVLIWIILRHTHHNDPEGTRACDALFGAASGKDAKVRKMYFVNDPEFDLQVLDNAPLSYIIDRFTDLVQNSLPIRKRRNRSSPLTHAAILSMFDAALKMPGWPKGDAAIPFVSPSAHRVDPSQFIICPPTGSRSSRRPLGDRRDDIDLVGPYGRDSKRTKRGTEAW
ncbi:hypothetical protein WOLCODRAFT_167302 [Wolfiporia cocos MD-104 SS10]|uniref:Fungal-type protein kinase domain-containing protein n=1 Tax=Wolfiporia cocos (strain MD-104) TaxID=742152 RepID=A0A2H3JM66_WOLCO|nr:hypothetical protein WOLCODRAFT_167302 [Wolfiporia cocos MD-104 SS10]